VVREWTGMASQGRVAVVTGASSGIGEAVARRLATDGMTVVAVARRADRLDALARQHPRIVAHPADISKRTDVVTRADRVKQDYGRCDVLVNNAGVPGGAFFGPEDLDELVRTMQVNFMGAANCMGLFRDLLVASAPSHVVNICSVSGKVGVGPAGYIASKFALVGFTEALSLAWAHDGIAVTQLNPGFIKTEGFPQQQVTRTGLGRLLRGPDVVAEAVVDVLRRRPVERTVPRWYRAFVVVRHVLPGVFWRLVARTPRGRGTRD
jgi:NAD(P)-dependent dehydrogenase (short-subunit alcohol dehydrogenase family)